MNIDKRTLAAIAAVAILAPVVGAAQESGSNAANKTAAQGSNIVYLGTAETPFGPQTVLTTTVKATGAHSYLIQVASECALETDVVSTTIDEHPEGYTATGSAEANVVFQVRVDGVPLHVSSDDPDGWITFCDRVHTQEISDIDDDTGNFTIRQTIESMSANAFNWVSVQPGAGDHVIEVVAHITADNTKGSYAEGYIGKRTLVVEPVKMANGATVTTFQPPAEDSGFPGLP